METFGECRGTVINLCCKRGWANTPFELDPGSNWKIEIKRGLVLMCAIAHTDTNVVKWEGVQNGCMTCVIWCKTSMCANANIGILILICKQHTPDRICVFDSHLWSMENGIVTRIPTALKTPCCTLCLMLQMLWGCEQVVRLLWWKGCELLPLQKWIAALECSRYWNIHHYFRKLLVLHVHGKK